MENLIILLSAYALLSYFLVVIFMADGLITFRHKPHYFLCFLLSPITLLIWLHGDELRKLFGKGENDA